MNKGGRPNIHGMCGTRFYKTWESMKRRCCAESDSNYKHYGERGISVCDGWMEFINFYNDMYSSYLEHEKLHGTKDTTIDRVDTNSNYTKNNCRWATMKEQQNNRRNNLPEHLKRKPVKNKRRKITFNGTTDTIRGWSERVGLNYWTLVDRLQSGWSEKDALTIKVNGRYKLST